MAMLTPTPPDLPLSASQRRVLPLDTILHGDCLDALRGLPDASVDAIVTDPPSGIHFMGKAWDSDKGGRGAWVSWLTEVMREALRVLKPGGHALVWALPRTSHWTATALEDAGFEVRDRLAHVFGSGFPKSLDVGKAIDKAAGAKRDVVATRRTKDIRRNVAADRALGWETRQGKLGTGAPTTYIEHPITAPATDAARQWDGYGTALKPAVEDWWLVRKPLAAATVAANVLAHGVGALNIAASRVGCEPIEAGRAGRSTDDGYMRAFGAEPRPMSAGRWPPNLLLSHSLFCQPDACAEGCPVRVLGEQSGVSPRGGKPRSQGRASSAVNYGIHARPEYDPYPDTVQGNSTAARFFPQFRPSPDDAPPFRYVAKASRRERNAGCEGLEAKRDGSLEFRNRESGKGQFNGPTNVLTANTHPTVKPLQLMSWLCALICPPGGVVLDPFAGSGSTLVAAKRGGWRYIGIEREAEYVTIAEARLAATREPSLGCAVALEPPKPVKRLTTKKRAAKRTPVADLWQESAV